LASRIRCCGPSADGTGSERHASNCSIAMPTLSKTPSVTARFLSGFRKQSRPVAPLGLHATFWRSLRKQSVDAVCRALDDLAEGLASYTPVERHQTALADARCLLEKPPRGPPCPTDSRVLVRLAICLLYKLGRPPESLAASPSWQHALPRILAALRAPPAEGDEVKVAQLWSMAAVLNTGSNCEDWERSHRRELLDACLAPLPDAVPMSADALEADTLEQMQQEMVTAKNELVLLALRPCQRNSSKRFERVLLSRFLRQLAPICRGSDGARLAKGLLQHNGTLRESVQLHMERCIQELSGKKARRTGSQGRQGRRKAAPRAYSTDVMLRLINELTAIDRSLVPPQRLPPPIEDGVQLDDLITSVKSEVAGLARERGAVKQQAKAAATRTMWQHGLRGLQLWQVRGAGSICLTPAGVACRLQKLQTSTATQFNSADAGGTPVSRRPGITSLSEAVEFLRWILLLVWYLLAVLSEFALLAWRHLLSIAGKQSDENPQGDHSERLGCTESSQCAPGCAGG